MPRAGPLTWVDGEGWLVLLGGGDPQRGGTDRVDTRVLSIANLDRPMVVLLPEGTPEQVTDILDHYMALGGPGGEGFVLTGMSRAQLQEPALLSLLSEAGILYLGGENPLFLARSLQNTPALQQIVRGFVTLQGLVIVGAGGGAMALGNWVLDPHGGSEAPGLNFLQNAIVAPHFTCTEEAGALRSLLREHPGFIGLGVPDGTALALGPRKQVETWGQGEVTAVVQQ